MGDIVNAVGFSVLQDYKYSAPVDDHSDDAFKGLLDRPNGNKIIMRYDNTTKLFTLTVAFCRVVIRATSDESKSLMQHLDNTIYQEMFGVVFVGERFIIGTKTYVVLNKLPDGTYHCARQKRGRIVDESSEYLSEEVIKNYIEQMNI